MFSEAILFSLIFRSRCQILWACQKDILISSSNKSCEESKSTNVCRVLLTGFCVLDTHEKVGVCKKVEVYGRRNPAGIIISLPEGQLHWNEECRVDEQNRAGRHHDCYAKTRKTGVKLVILEFKTF